MMNPTRVTRSLLAASLPMALAGCSWTGVNSMPLPFTKGGGDDDITITVQLANAANLVPNSEVKYNEITIGSVREIKLKDWTATLTVGLEGDAQVPADVTATVAQKSLLGAEYLALADPAEPAAQGDLEFLDSGDSIGVERTDRYPETEEVLAAGAMLLNGGGIQEVRTIAHELNAALTGRTDQVKSFMGTVSAFTGRLDAQRDNIASTLQQLDRLSRTVVTDRSKIAHALDKLPDGIELLSTQRQQLVATLKSMARFGRVADRVIGTTKVDFQKNLENIVPVTRALARSGKDLARSVDALSYPFSVRDASNTIFGDYMNLIAEVEVSADQLSQDWLGGTPLDGLFTGVIGGSPVGPAGSAPVPSIAGLLAGLVSELPGGRKPEQPSSPDDQPAGPLDTLVGNLLGGN